MHLRSCLLAVSLCAATLSGQTASPVTAPHVLLETVGPDGWRIRLGPTNLGSLLESEKGRTLWQPRMLPLLGYWQQLLGDEAAYAASRERLLNYGGRIRVGVWLGEGEFERQEVSQVAIVLEGDGRTDLGGLAKDVRLLQTRLFAGEWGEADVGGTKLALGTNEKDAMTAPLVEGNRLLIAMAGKERMATALPAARAFAATATGKAPPPNTPALRLQIDLAAIVAMSMKASHGEEGMMMKAFGLESLGNCQFAIETAGPHVRMELAQEFRSDERALFGALFPATAGVPALRLCIPTSPGSWKVGHFDFMALYKVIETAVSTMRGGTAEKMRAEAKKELGVDLAPDLLAHLTDEVLVITSPFVQIDRPEDVTWALAVRLRDEAAFGKNLMTVITHTKPFLQREATEKVGDVEVHRYGNMFGYDISMSVGNGVFVIAGGHDALPQITALLTAAKAMPKDAAAATAKLPAFDELQRHLPPGCNGLAVGDIDSIVALPTEWWLMALGELVPLPDMAPGDDGEQREAVRALLKQHGLATIRTATGYAERTWRWRLFW